MALGVSAILYSLMTNDELGLVPVLSMPAHLGLDAASGVLLAASAWIFGFSSVVWARYLILGLLEASTALDHTHGPFSRSRACADPDDGVTRRGRTRAARARFLGSGEGAARPARSQTASTADQEAARSGESYGVEPVEALREGGR